MINELTIVYSFSRLRVGIERARVGMLTPEAAVATLRCAVVETEIETVRVARHRRRRPRRVLRHGGGRAGREESN